MKKIYCVALVPKKNINITFEAISFPPPFDLSSFCLFACLLWFVGVWFVERSILMGRFPFAFFNYAITCPRWLIECDRKGYDGQSKNGTNGCKKKLFFSKKMTVSSSDRV